MYLNCGEANRLGLIIALTWFISTLIQNYLNKKLKSVFSWARGTHTEEELQSKEPSNAAISNEEMRVLYLLLSLIEEMYQADLVYYS